MRSLNQAVPKTAKQRRRGGNPDAISRHPLLFQFTTTGAMEREQACESFELLLQTVHQVLLLHQTPLSLELGVISGEVVQAIRTQNQHSHRSVKNALTSAFAGCSLTNLPESAFGAQNATTEYFADVDLENDLYSIRRWRELLTQSDPMSGLLSALATNQHSACFGHVSVSLHPMSAKRLQRHRQALLLLKSPQLRKRRWLAKVVAGILRSENPVARLVSPLFRYLTKPGEPEPSMSTASSRHHERETDLQTASNKLASACFEASIRIRVYAPQGKGALATSLIHQIFAPLAQYNAPRLGQFKLGRVKTIPARKRPRFLMSCSEISSLYHPPTRRTQRLATARFLELEPPEPLPLHSSCNEVMKLGRTCFHHHHEVFGLLLQDASLHGFVVGSSGSGKTTLLMAAICSLIEQGHGITLVDFHGDFARSIHAIVPKKHQNRIVSFSPLDDSPIAFNPLHCVDRDGWPLVTDSMVAAMKNLFGDSWGPRLEQILQMALSACIAAGDTTLQDVRSMLTNEPLRMNILSRVDDPVVRQFWLVTFASWGRRLQTEACQSVINKLDALLTPRLRSMLCQRGPSFDFRQAFDERKIVIVNLARGQVGQTAASTLGSLVLSAIQNAALSRAEVPEDHRVPHFVFLDELQLYSNPQALTSLLAEARKYRIAVWSATQSLSSVDRDNVLPIVLANAANFVSFRVSQNDATEIAQMLDECVSHADLVSLPRFHAYARLIVGGEVQPPFSLQTVVMRRGRKRS